VDGGGVAGGELYVRMEKSCCGYVSTRRHAPATTTEMFIVYIYSTFHSAWRILPHTG
jgi:hypothetical protein